MSGREQPALASAAGEGAAPRAARDPGPPEEAPETAPELRAIAQQLYGHVVDSIDFVRLYGFEQLLWSVLHERGIDDPEGEVARQLLVDVVTRAAGDPASYFPISPPHGITKEEAKAVEFDDDCPFCKMEAEEAAHAASPEGIADELAWQAELENMGKAFASSARAWREQHADALARRGLAPPSTTEPPAAARGAADRCT
ncbi:MAG: hypothetical protein M3680_04315, partial [Myxococcota bacterium]|nr:hypothetical protein [Myxococcota bacterium]